MVPAQEPSSKYQRGTITAVTAHPATQSEQAAVARYDVSVKVGDTVYVVLYTPPNGANGVEYSAGFDLLVLVGSDTLTFNSRLSGKTEVPILRRESLPATALDSSKLPGQYFSMKLQHLSESLNLSENQQRNIKPILEQEVGELRQYWGNPTISQKDKLKQWDKVVRSSDQKIKPLVSDEQWRSLEAMRKQQKQELKKLVADRAAGRAPGM
jgi:co-chaperonin GroES (HSP10)